MKKGSCSTVNLSTGKAPKKMLVYIKKWVVINKQIKKNNHEWKNAS